VHPYRVFISYSRDDSAIARELADALTRLGLPPVWEQTERKSEDKRTTTKQSAGSTQKDMKKSAAAIEEKKSGSSR
jgi:hypothetical protein